LGTHRLGGVGGGFDGGIDAAGVASRRVRHYDCFRGRRPWAVPLSVENPDALFGRVVSILEQARGQVFRAVNMQMVLSYWLIGREIVESMQGGTARASPERAA